MEASSNAAAVRQFVRYARATGIPLESILDEELMAVVHASVAADHVPAHALVDMLQICAHLTRRANLGAAAAAWVNVRGGFGPLSLLWEHAPTLADATRVNRRFMQRLDCAALALHAEDGNDELALQHLLMIPARYGGTQFIEATLTIELRVAQMVLGAAWSPARVELGHPAPASTRYLRGLFLCPIEFGADRNALVIKRDDMARPAVNGNAHMFAYLERHLESANRTIPIDLRRQVEHVIAAHLAGGHATLERVAHELAIGPRTLQRRLAESSGLTFASILEAVRRRVAEEYFQLESRPNLLQLAHRLGYADASGASRYLRVGLHTGVKTLRTRCTERPSKGKTRAPERTQIAISPARRE
ncbi:AraC family transcriptional regulator ligand-binding domain-containing protein [Xanthomonas hortorum]|uniref:AraC family transcriptional regulator ligand-binding domain-containing protein n=1 Tax=Xanthomonas hortorum TaxID=56454 RepID=UPI001B85C92F|nr:AraC family transcriptional regulator ligand-binding domain-containing protein [Xanthomonas hortorum]MCE4369625.1 AraC family transcriptional regulator ligand-binding domain-containing protein [Xanthomonas hortorum pv. hederae]